MKRCATVPECRNPTFAFGFPHPRLGPPAPRHPSGSAAAGAAPIAPARPRATQPDARCRQAPPPISAARSASPWLSHFTAAPFALLLLLCCNNVGNIQTMNTTIYTFCSAHTVSFRTRTRASRRKHTEGNIMKPRPQLRTEAGRNSGPRLGRNYGPTGDTHGAVSSGV